MSLMPEGSANKQESPGRSGVATFPVHSCIRSGQSDTLILMTTLTPVASVSIPEHFDTQGFIQSMIKRGWHWSESVPDCLVHPADCDLSIYYDRRTDRL